MIQTFIMLIVIYIYIYKLLNYTNSNFLSRFLLSFHINNIRQTKIDKNTQDIEFSTNLSIFLNVSRLVITHY